MSKTVLAPETADADEPQPRLGAGASIDAVVEHIKQQIKRGWLSAGQRLVEAEVVQATGVSRAHVRDAFKRLAAEGFLQIEEFKGASVKRLTRKDVTEMYQLREVLEGFAVRLAAQAEWSAAQRTELKRLQAEMDRAERELQHEQFRKLNDDYHLFIRRVAGNDLLHENLERLRLPLLLNQFHRFFDRQELVAANADHRLITHALLERDAKTAERVMTRHVRNSLKIIQALEGHFFA